MKKEKIKSKAQAKDTPKQIPQTKIPKKEYRFSGLLGLSVIIILGILIYSNSFDCTFNFDDIPMIADNKTIQNIDPGALWNLSQSRFLSFFSFAVNYHFGELNVWGYHLVNLVIHLINACLVYWLTLLIFSSPAMKENPATGHKQAIAFFTALLFVSHPLATQSVTYIVQRMASMAALFYLLSIALYLKARLSGQQTFIKYMFFSWALVSALLAILSKENAFTLPFALVLFEFFFLRTKKMHFNFKDYRIWLLIAGFLAIMAIALSRFSFNIFAPKPPSLGNAFTVTPGNYLLTQFSVIVKYMQLLLIPVNQNLDYNYPLSTGFFELNTLLSFLFLIALFILGIFLFKKNRIISFGIFWFFLTLSIESSIIPLEDVIYEHRTYLPSFGFFLVLSSGLFMLFWKRYKYLAIGIMLLLTGSYAYLANQRNKVWQDSLSLWSDIAAKSPKKVRPFVNLGLTYFNMGDFTKAVQYYSTAINLNPDFYETYYQRGLAFDNLGKISDAISDYSRALEKNPNYSKAYSNRGVAYASQSNWEKAIADYSKAIEFDPNFETGYFNRGIAYGSLGQWDKALSDYTLALGINPSDAQVYYRSGIAFGNLNQPDKAIANYSRATVLDPKYTLAYYRCGMAYGNLGKWDSAIAVYSKAIEADPKFVNGYYGRGMAYGSIGQWEKAIADYSKVLELDPKFTNASASRENALRELNKRKK